MSENVTKPATFSWNGKKERAAALLAADELTDREIASETRVEPRTLHRWKLLPEFAAKVKEQAEALGEVARRYAVGRRARRFRELESRRLALEAARKRVEEALAAPPPPPAGGPAPAPDTGLTRELVRLSKALLDLEKQAAVEAGQWTKQHEVRGAVASVSVIPEISELLKMPAEELLRLHLETLGLPGPGDRG